MKDISRRSFIKGALAGTASIAAFGLTNGHAFAEESVYTPGTYSATADGMGKVKVTMTFSETAITDVVLDVSNETPSIGGAPETEAALRAAILDAQSGEIDAVSGASITSSAVSKAAKKVHPAGKRGDPCRSNYRNRRSLRRRLARHCA